VDTTRISDEDERMSKLAQQTQKTFTSSGKTYTFSSLPELAKSLGKDLTKLPISIRIVLESVLRNCDGKKVADKDVEMLASWNAKKPASEEIPFVVARIVLQDFTGVPLLVDLAAMRTAVAKMGKDPKKIEPLVPVDLVIDHSVQVDASGSPDALAKNMALEMERNGERYEFLKWGQQAFETFKVVPPGIGIVHQVNLEYLAQGVCTQKTAAGTVAYPDTLVGTDSHTTMINGVGVVGWGVGGIEAEAGMLGQPIYFLTPEVVGCYLHGAPKEGVTATDVVLTLTEMLRKAKVVGKFVEFYGPGAVALSAADRATVANMAPEYGATMGFFPVDDETCAYYHGTGRTKEQVALVKDYFTAQGLFGIPQKKGDIAYSVDLELDLASVVPSLAGPKRPQDKIALSQAKESFTSLFAKPIDGGGFGKKLEDLTGRDTKQIGHGSVLIAAITSCTNTSNPSVMLAAGLLAKKAVEKGLKVNPVVKTSLAPGSRVVTKYLADSGLQPYLDKLNFQIVGYGCTTCIGNSGPLSPEVETAITKGDLIAASVLSGNRNFEARVHPSIKSNFLMSPPLVVAFAIAGRADIDMAKEPLGTGSEGKPVFLKDIWPTNDEVRSTLKAAMRPEIFQQTYKSFAEMNPAWNAIPSTPGELYKWNEKSTYIQEPPFFKGFSMQAGTIQPIQGARALGIFGDSVTTDHISPAGSFKKETPAGKFLQGAGVEVKDFNSYGSRRGNDRIMTRGTFANVRIKNLMIAGKEGGFTKNWTKGGAEDTIYDACMDYQKAGTPLVVFGGKEYGTGSSRDWAAKGTNLLGIKAVVTESFERIHRSNLVGMGVLPCCFEEGTNAQTLGLKGDETFSFIGLTDDVKPRQKIQLEITGTDGSKRQVPVIVRIDTPIEVEYYRHGGILPFVLRQIVAG
jgi:aconitate hydratase